MLQFALRNPPSCYVQQGEPTNTSQCSEDQPPCLQKSCFQQEKKHTNQEESLTLQPSQEMELLQKQENMENPEQPDRILLFQTAWKN